MPQNARGSYRGIQKSKRQAQVQPDRVFQTNLTGRPKYFTSSSKYSANISVSKAFNKEIKSREDAVYSTVVF